MLQKVSTVEDRREPMRIVLFRCLAWLAEAGSANAKVAPKQVMSAIALATLIMSPPPLSLYLAMLRPGYGEWQGYKVVSAHDLATAAG